MPYSGSMDITKEILDNADSLVKTAEQLSLELTEDHLTSLITTDDGVKAIALAIHVLSVENFNLSK